MDTPTPSFAPRRSAKPVIALDGPAASGKGTLAKRIAAHYGFAHLDTGLLYRGVAWLVLESGADPGRRDAAIAAATRFSLDLVSDAPIRTPAVGAAASVVAAYGEVRQALFDFQRRFAAEPPGGADGAVIDGRDIGTVICPDACVKFFVTAAAPVRARRRWLEQRDGDPARSEADVLADIEARDARDAARPEAPLRQADDAELLDTTHLSIDAAFETARLVIDSAFERCGGPSGPRL